MLGALYKKRYLKIFHFCKFLVLLLHTHKKNMCVAELFLDYSCDRNVYLGKPCSFKDDNIHNFLILYHGPLSFLHLQQDSLMAGNALEFLGLNRSQYEPDPSLSPSQSKCGLQKHKVKSSSNDDTGVENGTKRIKLAEEKEVH